MFVFSSVDHSIGQFFSSLDLYFLFLVSLPRLCSHQGMIHGGFDIYLLKEPCITKWNRDTNDVFSMPIPGASHQESPASDSEVPRGRPFHRSISVNVGTSGQDWSSAAASASASHHEQDQKAIVVLRKRNNSSGENTGAKPFGRDKRWTDKIANPLGQCLHFRIKTELQKLSNTPAFTVFKMSSSSGIYVITS